MDSKNGCDTPNQHGLGTVQGQGTKGKVEEMSKNEDSNIEQQAREDMS